MQAAIEKFNDNTEHVRIDISPETLSNVVAYAAELTASSPPVQPSSAAPQNSWTELIPNCISSIDDRINYLAFVIAVDYRHWGYENKGGYTGVSGTEDEQLLLPPGSLVEHKDFFAIVRSKDKDDPKNGTKIRGSMGMMQLVKQAVEMDGFHWYKPEVALDSFKQGRDVGHLWEMFRGVQVDGKTPMMLPDVDGRVNIIVDICNRFIETGTSFASMVRNAQGNVFGIESTLVQEALLGVRPTEMDAANEEIKSIIASSPTQQPPPALIPQLLDLHPRYTDFGIFGLEDQNVPLLKLSKLTVISLQAAFPQFFPLPNQLELLSVCPDYQVPRALRELGVLDYSDSLDRKLNYKMALEPGVSDEVEIRLGCMVAAEALRREMKVSVSTIDFILWSYGRAKCKKPHHYCVTQMY